MTGGMRTRRILLVAFAYVVLDLASPMIPGAFSFDPAESVDVVTAVRARPAALSQVGVVPSSPASPCLIAGTIAATTDGSARSPRVPRRSHTGQERSAPSDPGPSPDDD